MPSSNTGTPYIWSVPEPPIAGVTPIRAEDIRAMTAADYAQHRTELLGHFGNRYFVEDYTPSVEPVIGCHSMTSYKTECASRLSGVHLCGRSDHGEMHQCECGYEWS